MRKAAKTAVKTWSTPPVEEKAAPIPCSLCGGAEFKPALDCGDFRFVRCVECGLIQANPQPDPQAIAARYREGHGEDYLAYELANEAPFLRLQELALADAHFDEIEEEARRAAKLRGEDRPRVLDVGCAVGALLERLRDRGWECKGVELSAPQADYARRVRGLDVRDVTIEKARFPDGSFDLIHASHLIEHLNDPRSFLRECYRLLRPGGRLILTTPNAAGFQARLFGPSWRSAIFDHLYLFSLRTLGRLLESENFIIERKATWGGLAAGTAPGPIKNFADRAAKRWGFGDVMMLSSKRLP
jgi:SAM-dependent methyltransferase